MTTEALPTIEHRRDVIRDDSGQVEQDYNYLVYRFVLEGVAARAYLDTPGLVSVMRPGAVPEAVLVYLQARFDRIDQLDADGYKTIWTQD